MKEIRTIKMVEQTEVKFVADDGKEFIGANAEIECKRYERTQNEKKVINEFKKLRPKWLSIPLLDYFMYEGEVISVTVKDEIEFDTTVKDYYHIKSPRYMDFDGFESKKPNEFPANIVIVNGCEWVDIFGSEKELKDKLIETIEQLG